jgi:hypothetical protein
MSTWRTAQAKQVAATHASDPTHNAPTKATHNPDDPVQVQQAKVEDK